MARARLGQNYAILVEYTKIGAGVFSPPETPIMYYALLL